MSKNVTGNIFEELKKLRSTPLNEDIVVDFEKEGEEEPAVETPVEEVPVEEEPVEENVVKAVRKPIKFTKKNEEEDEEPIEGPEMTPDEVEDVITDEETYVAVDEDGFIVTCPHCGQNVYLDQASDSIESIEDTETGELYPVESKKTPEKKIVEKEVTKKSEEKKHPIKEMMDILSTGTARKQFKEGKMTTTSMKRYLKEEWGVSFEDK